MTRRAAKPTKRNRKAMPVSGRLRKKLEPRPWIDPTVGEAIECALIFHRHRDTMNSALHRQQVRWSPLTLLLEAAQGVLKMRTR